MNNSTRKILALLRRNGRSKYKEMGNLIEEPLTSAYLKHKQLEQRVIKKYATMVHFQKLGYVLRYFVLIKTKSLPDHILHHPCINSVYTINNGYRYMLDLYVKDLESFETFHEQLKILEAGIKIVPVIQTLDEERFLDS